MLEKDSLVFLWQPFTCSALLIGFGNVLRIDFAKCASTCCGVVVPIAFSLDVEIGVRMDAVSGLADKDFTTKFSIKPLVRSVKVV